MVNVPVNVPLLITGEFDTDIIDGKANPTDVTVPCGFAAVVTLVTRP